MSGSMCRRFHGVPVVRLIISVPVDKLADIDRLIDLCAGSEHPARGCRAEFVRLALAEKLERDLMICAPQKRGQQS